jgi:HTH-type transcriptional regulator / antitoxin HigA
MRAAGLVQKGLEPLIGSRARVSEVLTGRRQLTLPMIGKIHRLMSISRRNLDFDITARSKSITAS